MSENQAHSKFRESFNASSLIGLSSLINIVIGMFRTKIIAVLLGPDGIGLMGIYTSITSFISASVGMGLDNSGVREIAAASGTDKPGQVAKVVTVLRHTAIALGAAGALFMILFAGRISEWSFGNHDFVWQIRVLSITVFLAVVSMGQKCVLQGIRNIKAVAQLNIWSSVFSTIIAVPCYYFWGISGIVIGLVLCGAAQMLTSYLYVRKARIHSLPVSLAEHKTEAAKLIKLGFSFMCSAFLFLGSNYVINIIIIKKLGMNDLGMYQTAFSLSAVLFGFIFNAMGTDFYPKLTGLRHDAAAMQKEVNLQCEMCLLLSMPLILSMIFFAPLAIAIFYTEKFFPAIPMLQIIAMACFIQMLSFPIGYVMLAKGMGKFIIIKGILSGVLNILLCYWLIPVLGINGAAWAFLLMYVGNTLLNIGTAFWCSKVCWTWHILALYAVSAAVVFVSFCCARLIAPGWLYYLVGVVFCGGVSFVNLHILLGKMKISLGEFVKSQILKRIGKRVRPTG